MLILAIIFIAIIVLVSVLAIADYYTFSDKRIAIRIFNIYQKIKISSPASNEKEILKETINEYYKHNPLKYFNPKSANLSPLLNAEDYKHSIKKFLFDQIDRGADIKTVVFKLLNSEDAIPNRRLSTKDLARRNKAVAAVFDKFSV